MRKISTYLKSLELMENRNYTVELWKRPKTVASGQFASGQTTGNWHTDY